MPSDAEAVAAAERASIISQAANPSSFHPMHSIFATLDAFGPLIFPLYREALLRRRILMLQRPPLQSSCETGMFATDSNRPLVESTNLHQRS